MPHAHLEQWLRRCGQQHPMFPEIAARQIVALEVAGSSPVGHPPILLPNAPRPDNIRVFLGIARAPCFVAGTCSSTPANTSHLCLRSMTVHSCSPAEASPATVFDCRATLRWRSGLPV